MSGGVRNPSAGGGCEAEFLSMMLDILRTARALRSHSPHFSSARVRHEILHAGGRDRWRRRRL